MGENELAGVHAVVVPALAEALSHGRSLVRYPFCFKQGEKVVVVAVVKCE